MNDHRTAYSQDDRLNIIATTTIIADVVRQVAGDAADVTSLIPNGADPHAFQPSAQDIIAMDEADLVFINGANFEESLLDVIYEIAGDRTHVISDCVDIREFGADAIHQHDSQVNEHKGNAENDSDRDDLTTLCNTHYVELDALEQEHNLHVPEYANRLGRLYTLNCVAEAACDPHVWLDVRNVMLWTLYARDMLVTLDADNAAIYQANAAAYLEELTQLSSELDAQFASIPLDERILITNHDVLGYLADRYGFEIVGTVLVGGSAASEPSAQDLVEIIQIVQDTGAKAIFADNTINGTVARQVAEETGVPVIPMYTGSLSEPDGDAGTYLDYMRFDANLLVGSLSR